MGLRKGQRPNHAIPVGIKGRSGRKGVGYEMASWNKLNEMFFGTNDIVAVTGRIQSGKYKAEDMFMYKLLLGNTDLLKTVIGKLFPDSLLVKRAPIIDEPLTDDEKNELSELVERALNEFNEIGYEIKIPKALPMLNGSATVESSPKGTARVRQGKKKGNSRK